MDSVSEPAPTFSILLPTHNRADVLPFAIRSVLYQTLSDFELLIVGDGCTDQTSDIVRGFSDSRVHWFDLPKAPNFGYANRNIVLREARGKYIAFMAHDDLWLPDHLELLGGCMADPQTEIAYTRPLWVIPPGCITPATFNLHDEATLELFLTRQRNAIPAGCVVHRRACFEKYGYWNEELSAGADNELWARIIKGGKSRNFAYLPEPTCLHFRANWRTEVNAGPSQLEVWKQLHAVENFMPPVLKVAVPEKQTEQQAVWQAIAVNPRDWTRELRTAIHTVIDKRIAVMDELVSEVLRRNPAGGDEDVGLMDALVQLAPELQNMKPSLAWKLVRQLRAVKKLVRG
ncbi:MAG: glycosyltransferase [Pyrinomonadaceae bacterium]